MVIYADEDTKDRLYAFESTQDPRFSKAENAYGSNDDIRDEYEPFVFGKLNLLLCYTKRAYHYWQRGTNELKAMRPVTRDFAIKHLEELREKLKEEELARKS